MRSEPPPAGFQAGVRWRGGCGGSGRLASGGWLAGGGGRCVRGRTRLGQALRSAFHVRHGGAGPRPAPARRSRAAAMGRRRRAWASPPMIVMTATMIGAASVNCTATPGAEGSGPFRCPPPRLCTPWRRVFPARPARPARPEGISVEALDETGTATSVRSAVPCAAGRPRSPHRRAGPASPATIAPERPPERSGVTVAGRKPAAGAAGYQPHPPPHWQGPPDWQPQEQLGPQPQLDSWGSGVEERAMVCLLGKRGIDCRPLPLEARPPRRINGARWHGAPLNGFRTGTGAVTRPPPVPVRRSRPRARR